MTRQVGRMVVIRRGGHVRIDIMYALFICLSLSIYMYTVYMCVYIYSMYIYIYVFGEILTTSL